MINTALETLSFFFFFGPIITTYKRLSKTEKNRMRKMQEDFVNENRSKILFCLKQIEQHAVEIKRYEDEIEKLESSSPNSYFTNVTKLYSYRGNQEAYFGRIDVPGEFIHIPEESSLRKIVFRIGSVDQYKDENDPQIAADALKSCQERLKFYRRKRIREILDI